MSKHYKYGGSTAARTIACPSWVDAAKAAPEQQSSVFAEEGTLLHEYSEKILLGEMAECDIADDDHRERVEDAIHAWDKLSQEYGVIDYNPEEMIEINADVGGTCDIIAWCKDGRYIIGDFKFGQGIEVGAVGNKQLMFYAMLVEHQQGKPFTALTVAIIQPIPSRGTQTLKTWDVPLDIYEMFKQSFWKATQSKGMASGPHCQWCPAAAYCPEKSGEARKAMMASTRQSGELADNLAMALNLESWIAEVKKEAHSQLELGTAVKGYKLVQKRATRKWADVELIADQLKALKIAKKDAFVAKLISPAQAEKLLKQKGIDVGKIGDYITSVSTGTTLATEDDSREAVMSSSAMSAALGRLT